MTADQLARLRGELAARVAEQESIRATLADMEAQAAELDEMITDMQALIVAESRRLHIPAERNLRVV